MPTSLPEPTTFQNTQITDHTVSAIVGMTSADGMHPHGHPFNQRSARHATGPSGAIGATGGSTTKAPLRSQSLATGQVRLEHRALRLTHAGPASPSQLSNEARNARLLEDIEECRPRHRVSTILSDLDPQGVHDDTGCEIEKVEQEVVGVNDVDVQMVDGRRREVSDVERDQCGCVRVHCGGQHVAILLVAGHRVGQLLVSGDDRFRKRVGRGQESFDGAGGDVTFEKVAGELDPISSDQRAT